MLKRQDEHYLRPKYGMNTDNNLNNGNHVLVVILRDWSDRVLADCAKKKLAPLPWQTRQALGWCNTMLLRMAGEWPPDESDGPGDY